MFELKDLNRLDDARRAITSTGYNPGDATVLSTPLPSVTQEISGNFDLLIIGSGGSAFSAAIQAVSYAAKVAMVERVRLAAPVSTLVVFLRKPCYAQVR